MILCHAYISSSNRLLSPNKWKIDNNSQIVDEKNHLIAGGNLQECEEIKQKAIDSAKKGKLSRKEFVRIFNETIQIRNKN